MAGARRPRRNLAVALAVSLGAHLVVLGLLVPDTPIRRATDAPVFDVELLPPARHEEPKRRQVVRAAPSPATARPRSASQPADAASPGLQAPAFPQSTAPVEPVQPLHLGGGQGLNFSDGCDPRRLVSARERRECAIKQMAQARLRPPPQVEDDLSQGGRFAPPDPLPYLARQPKTGCKPKTGGGSAMDTQDIPVLGIACVFHF
jgi:hypothetical protein